MSTLPYRLAAQMQDNLGASSNFDDAVFISNRLKENMDAEGRCSNECFVEVLAMLSPLQQVRSGPCTCSRPGQHLASSRARPPHNLAALQQSRLAAVHDPRQSAAAVQFTGWRAAQCRVEAVAEEASLACRRAWLWRARRSCGTHALWQSCCRPSSSCGPTLTTCAQAPRASWSRRAAYVVNSVACADAADPRVGMHVACCQTERLSD